MTTDVQSLARGLRNRGDEILTTWLRAQAAAVGSRQELLSGDQLRAQSRDFLDAFTAALETHDGRSGITSPVWAPIRDRLSQVSDQRARQGFTPTETALFVFSLKEPLFEEMGRIGDSAEAQMRLFWIVSKLIDDLGLFTTDAYLKNREAIISRQQSEVLELSTPVVTLWKGVLALPLIGTLDSERTQVVMENLLQRIVETGATIAILDITGVPTVDTLVAQHILKTVAAARLMGADCIISGIRPQIAQTIVHLGIDLETVTTKATLADAFAVALDRLNLGVMRRRAASASTTPAAS
jgi:rsbT co-antagonist protein RsbR